MDVVDLTPDDDVVPAHLTVVDDDAQLLPTVEFYGRRFAVRERMSLLPMMKFATIAKRQKAQAGQPGAPSDGQQEMEALAALFELLEQCIAPSDFGAFYEHALSVGAQQQDLMQLVADAGRAAQSGEAREPRPSQPSSNSPAGRSTTAPSSGGGSSSAAASVPMGSLEVQRAQEARGRPDIALVVQRAREASTRTSTG